MLTIYVLNTITKEFLSLTGNFGNQVGNSRGLTIRNPYIETKFENKSNYEIHVRICSQVAIIDNLSDLVKLLISSNIFEE